MRAPLASVVTLVAAVAGCGDVFGRACTGNYVYGVSVVVRRAGDAAPIYDATVTLADGSYRETARLSVFRDAAGAPTGPAVYEGAGERGGDYVITVSAPGYRSITREASLDRDGCHVETVAVAVALAPL